MLRRLGGKSSLVAVGGLLVIQIAACANNDIQVTPAGGGGHHETRTLTVTTDQAWKNGKYILLVSEPVKPRGIPYTVQTAGNVIRVAAFVDAPHTSLPTVGGGQDLWMRIKSVDGVQRVAPAGYVFDRQSPDSVEPGYGPWLRALIATSYEGGHGSPPQDSAFFQVRIGNTINWANAIAVFPGQVTTAPPSLSGSGNLAVNDIGSFQAQPDWDTTGYTYQWLVDGSSISGATNATFNTSFPSSSYHTVKAVIIRTDSTADTVTLNVNTNLAEASINGPSVLNDDWTGTWTASVTGGRRPYTYQWGGFGYGSNSSYSGNPGYTSDLTLDVWDADGAHVSTSFTVTVTGCSGGNIC